MVVPLYNVAGNNAHLARTPSLLVLVALASLTNKNTAGRKSGEYVV
jgi:hypothetical protein